MASLASAAVAALVTATVPASPQRPESTGVVDAVLARAGIGKGPLTRCVAGLHRPSRGTIRLHDIVLARGCSSA
ncbi:hypothetical protein [Kibdelosporangium aridum]|uniref:hypothetical protein n=1 Tax=Kibdelosporangium aridum TaxID=2030 RepID=UPI0035ED059D